MKRVLAILSAAVFLFGSVACEKEKYAEVDLSKATAPVLGSYTVNADDGVVAKFTPGSFGQSFNEKMPVNHSLAIVELDGEAVSKTLTTKNSEGTLTVTPVNLTRALMTLGKAEGSTASLALAVRASMQDQSRDNGLNGFIDSEGLIKVSNWLVELPEIVGSPYQDYTEASEWSLIGAMAEYGISWDGDLNMWTDGNGNHVAAHVTLKAGDEVKFRKDQAWDENFGGTMSEVGAEFSVAQNGDNIKITADGVYDIFLNTIDQTAIVAAAFDPYPAFTQESNWSVIGALSKYGIEWNGDIAMVSDGTTHAAFGVSLAAADEFKFRQDKDWAVNLGGDFGGLDNDFAVAQDGDNIKVGADGEFDLFVNPTDLTAKVSAASGVKVSTKIEASEPPAPVEITGWNIIGLNGDWDNDILATNEGNLWTAVITAESDTEFKWRKDGAWDENYGGVMVALGEPFEAVAGGDNIKIPAGMYKVVLDLDALTITVSEASFELPDIDLSKFEVLADDMSGAETWGIIGPAMTGWDTDVDLKKIQDDPEIWGAMNLPFNAGTFKFRGNDEWGAYDLGGGTFAIGEPVQMIKGGGDMTAPAGVYTVFLYPTYGIFYLQQGEGEVPVSDKPLAWSLIGTIGGSNWDTDFDLSNPAGDTWKISNVAMNEGEEFKIRADHKWDESYGGPEANAQSTIDAANPYGVYAPAIGTAFEAGSVNIRVPASGNFDVTFDYAAKTILIEEHKEFPDQLYMIGEEFGGWDWSSDGVVEMIPVINNEWGGDATGQFYAIRYISAGKGFKFCSQRAWSGDFWGLGENDGFTEAGGNCTVDADGIYMIHVDFKNNKVHVEPARVYGIGDCAGGKWDEGMEEVLYQADGKSLKLTLANSGSVRAYVASAISTSSWWTREFAVIDGKIVYRTGDELSWPSGSKDQVVTFNFNEGTGSISGEAAPAEPYALIGWHAASNWDTNVGLEAVEGSSDWKVAKNIIANGGNIDFKFRRGTAWTPQVGAENKNPKNVNELFKLKEKTEGSEPDPANIHLNGDGQYDVYFNEKEMIGFILNAGTTFAVPTTWESTETPEMAWFIIGDAVGGWSSENDVPLVSVDDTWYAAKGVTMEGGKNFKFRADHAWTYQLTQPGVRTPGEVFDLQDGSGENNDMQLAETAIYDVYLAKDLSKARIDKVGEAN